MSARSQNRTAAYSRRTPTPRIPANQRIPELPWDGPSQGRLPRLAVPVLEGMNILVRGFPIPMLRQATGASS